MTTLPIESRRRFWRTILFSCSALIVLLVVIFFLWPNTDNTWVKTKVKLEARGEVLDWAKIVPTEPPPGKNLFENLIAASLLPLKGKPTPPNPLGAPAPAFPPDASNLGIPFDIAKLKEIGAGYRSFQGSSQLKQFEKWFAQWDESFAELRDAGSQPYARLPGDYTNPIEAPMLNFVAIRNLAQVLVSRAKVHLLLGDSAGALQDLDTIAVVMRALQAGPGSLVSAMIEVAVSGLYVEVVTDGLKDRLWQERELRELIPRLLRVNLLASVENAFRTERVAVLRHLDALANRGRDPLYGSTVRAFGIGSEGFLPSARDLLVRISPPNWIRRNQAHYAVIIQDYLDAIDFENMQVNIEKIERSNTALRNLTSRWSPHTVLVLYVTPNFQKAAETMIRNQTTARQAALACGLELYRLKSGMYPDSLSHLVPDFLSAVPSDILPGARIVYEKTTNGWGLTRVKNRSAVPNNPRYRF